MASRRYELPATHAWRTAGSLIAATAALSMLIAWWLQEHEPGHVFWTYAVWCAVLTGGVPSLYALMGAIREWRSPSPRVVEVGEDGVLVGARFISYADIGGVDHQRRSRTANIPVQGGGDLEQTLEWWTVSIHVEGVPGGGTLLGGETVDLVTSRSGSEDLFGAQIARTIEEGLRGWSERRRLRGEDLDAALLRGARTAREWLDALHKLGFGARTSYRAAAARTDELARLLDDPRRKPWERAAAAVVLAAAGDETAAPRLRIAAGAMVDARVRIALESVADERAVAEALAALEALEGEDRGEEVRGAGPCQRL